MQPFILYVKAAVEARIDARRTTEVLQRRYFSAVHDRDMDVVWSAAGVVALSAAMYLMPDASPILSRTGPHGPLQGPLRPRAHRAPCSHFDLHGYDRAVE